MNREKLKNIELQGGIDTLEIISPDVSATEANNALKDAQLLKGWAKKEITLFKYIVNPNETAAGESYCYSEHQSAIEDILSEAEITNYRKSRVDFKIDSFQDNYNEFLKLNKCIILLLSLKYKLKNRYQSFASMSADLYGNGFEVYEVGDGKKVANILTAIWDANEIARLI